MIAKRERIYEDYLFLRFLTLLCFFCLELFLLLLSFFSFSFCLFAFFDLWRDLLPKYPKTIWQFNLSSISLSYYLLIASSKHRTWVCRNRCRSQQQWRRLLLPPRPARSCYEQEPSVHPFPGTRAPQRNAIVMLHCGDQLCTCGKSWTAQGRACIRMNE